MLITIVCEVFHVDMMWDKMPHVYFVALQLTALPPGLHV
jgi:hypothetical protein